MIILSIKSVAGISAAYLAYEFGYILGSIAVLLA